MIVCCDFPEIGLPVTLLAYLAHWVVWGSAWSWGSILIFDFVVSSFLLVVRYWYCLGLMIRLTIYGKSCGISLIATWLKYLGQIRVIARILYFAGWTKIYPCIEEILWTWILGQFRKGIKSALQTHLVFTCNILKSSLWKLFIEMKNTSLRNLIRYEYRWWSIPCNSVNFTLWRII